MRKHPVIYAIPVVLVALTLATSGVLELAGAECYDTLEGEACNDAAEGQRIVALFGFSLAALFLLLVLFREVSERMDRR